MMRERNIQPAEVEHCLNYHNTVWPNKLGNRIIYRYTKGRFIKVKVVAGTSPLVIATVSDTEQVLKMKYKYDKKIDAIYIKFSDMPYEYGIDLDDERRIDYDANNKVRGVELHNIKYGVDYNGLPKAKEIAGILEELGVKEYA